MAVLPNEVVRQMRNGTSEVEGAARPRAADAGAQRQRAHAEVSFPGARALFVASVYGHLATFHLPYIRLLQAWGVRVDAAAAPDAARETVASVADRCFDVGMARSPFRIRNLLATARLWRIMRQEKYNLIHVHTPVASALGRVAGFLAGVPSVIYTAHGFHFYQGGPMKYWALYYPIERILAHCTDVIITINHEDYERAQGFCLRRGGRVVLVPGVGVDIGRFAKQVGSPLIRDRLGIPQEALVLLAVGEINLNKNYTELLKVVGMLTKDYPHLYALIVGDGPLKGSLQRLISRAGLGERVRLLGFRSDIPELLAASDLVVSFSKREGLPVSLIEAAAAGRPIIATDVRGNRDVVEQVGGELVPPGNAVLAARAISELLADPERRRHLGEEASKRSIVFALSRPLKALTDIYRMELSRTSAHQASNQARSTR